MPHIREAIENTLQVDLGSVRLHSDAAAQDKAHSLSARAFTFANHIFLGKGEHPTDLPLISHEAAHVVQQQAGAHVQAWSANRSDRYEREADQAAAAVSRNQSFAVRERVASPCVQRLGISDALDYFADKAYNIPGFRMFTIVLGVNPINMEHVDRSAANVLRAVVEFIPGGHLITQALDKYSVFDKVGDWVQKQLDTLAMTGSAIKDALMDFLHSLSWRDIFHLGRVWDRAKRIFTDPIDRIKDFVVGFVEGIWKFVRDAILKPIAALASKTAGWDLLCAVLGRNPITGEAVPQTAENLIGGFMKLIHEEEVWNNLQKAKAVPRAFAWFKGVLSGLLGFVTQIPGLFIKALKSLTWTDVIDLPAGFLKVAGVFGKFLVSFISWAGQKVWDLLQIIFEVVAPAVMPYLKRLGAAFRSVLKHPLHFMHNLIAAGKLGFEQFVAKIGAHLKAAFIEWLTGSLPGVYIPKALDLHEILKFVLSVLGLTWQNIRAKLVKLVGETTVKAMETGFDIVVTLVKEGPAAAWEKIKDELSNLKDMLMQAVMNFVIETIVKKAVAKIVSLFVPGGAFIQAIISIYDTVMVFVHKLAKIIQVVKSFLDSFMLIANGAIGVAANKVESTLAGLLVLAINFLAGFLGLGKIADKVMDVINTKVRDPIDKALDSFVKWVATMAKKLWTGAKSVAKKAVAGLAGLLGIRKEVHLASGETHTLSFVERGPRMVLMAASTPTEFRQFINGIGAPGFMQSEKSVAVLMVDRIDALEDDTRSTNADHNEQIVGLLESIGEMTTNIMNKAFRHDVRTIPPTFAGLRDGFGRGMRVMLATNDIRPGTDPSAVNNLWNDLNLRQSGEGSYYVRGHLLNEKLGGSGSIWENLTPLSRSGNSQHESRAESIIKPKPGEIPRYFLYVVTPTYGRTTNTALIAQINSPANADPPTIKAAKTRIVRAEASVPTNMTCSITELDEGGKKKSGAVDATYTIENVIDQSGPAGYKV